MYGTVCLDSDWRWWKLHVCDDKQIINVGKALLSTQLVGSLYGLSQSSKKIKVLSTKIFTFTEQYKNICGFVKILKAV